MGRLSRATRLGDGEKGLCDMQIHTHHHHCPHRRNGVFNGGGSPNVYIEGVAAIREGDGGMCNCPHEGRFTASEGSGSVYINGKAAVRIKDETKCEKCGENGYVTGGASSVFFGD